MHYPFYHENILISIILFPEKLWQILDVALVIKKVYPACPVGMEYRTGVKLLEVYKNKICLQIVTKQEKERQFAFKFSRRCEAYLTG